jgi:hypothetical protein
LTQYNKKRVAMTRRILIAAAVLALAAAACGGSNEGGSEAETAGTTMADVPTTAAAEPAPVPAQGVLPQGPSALQTSTAEEFPPSLVDPAEIISGGPPPDGIPPLDSPVFVDVADSLAEFEPEEAVVAIELNGDARAYPVQIMIWHEIVNDTVGGVPVSVTYCPLCNSAVSYRREIRGVETTFGTSGRLFSSALVMYDRATETLWTHFDGKAVVGLLAGEELEAIPSPLMSWSDFAAVYPTGKVLDPTATGFNRDYGRNPYAGYDNEESEPFLFTGVVDPRAAAKLRVVGIEIEDEARAFALSALSDGLAKATNTSVGDVDVAIFWKAGQATALDSSAVADGRDVGSVSVFDPVVTGRTLTFAAAGERFVDEQTGTVWNLAGEALEGELVGTQLDRIVHLDTFWFAWATYRPGTELVEAGS